MREQISLKIKPDVVKKIRKYAEKENRSLNNYIENLMIKDIEFHEHEK